MPENIIIEFTPKGDQALVQAIKKLDQATQGLLKSQASATDQENKGNAIIKKHEKQIESLRIKIKALGGEWSKNAQIANLSRKAMKGNQIAMEQLRIVTGGYRKELMKTSGASLLSVRNNRILGGSFAVLRSKILIASFAMMLFERAIMSLIKAYGKQELGGLKVSNTLKSTAFAAGITKKEIISLTQELQETGVVGDEVNLQMSSLMLTYTKIGKEVFPRALKAANDMATSIAGGIPTTEDLRSKVTMLSKALQDPIKGMSALGRVGFTLSETQKELVKSFVNAGDVISAQNIILEAAELQYGEMAKAIKVGVLGQLNDMNMAWGDASEVIGKVLAEQIMPLVGGLTSLGKAMNPERVRAYVLALETVVGTLGAYVVATKLAVLWTSRMGIGLLATGLGIAATEVLLASGYFKDFADEVDNATDAFKRNAMWGRKTGENLTQGWQTGAGGLKETIAELTEMQEDWVEGSVHVIVAGDGVADKSMLMVYSLEQLKAVISGLRGALDPMSEAQAKLVTKYEGQIAVLKELDPITKEQLKVSNQLGIELSDLDPTLANIIKKYHELVAVKKAEIIATQTSIEVNKAKHDAQLENISTLTDATEQFLMFDNQRHLDNEKSKMQAEIDAVNASHKSKQQKAKEVAAIEKKMADLEKQQHNRQLTIKQLLLAVDLALSIGKIKVAQAAAEALIRAKYALVPFGQVIAEAEIAQLRALNAVSIGTAVAGAAIGAAGMQAQKYAKGGEFITNRPELIQVGEAGREHVKITPIDRPADRALGESPITINFSGNVLSQDFIENEAIPQIKEAVRRGADLGVA